jgi:hypothetical protein
MHDLSTYTITALLARMDRLAVGPSNLTDALDGFYCDHDEDCAWNSVFAISDYIDSITLSFEWRLEQRLQQMVDDSLNHQYLIALQGERKQAERQVKYLYRKVAAA